MNKIIGMLLLIVFFSSKVNAQEEMKVITYNVLEGLGNEEDYGKNRHERFVAWVQNKKPDVIALQELYRSEEKFASDAESWGHKYYAKRGALGFSSNEPITEVNKHKIEGLWHGLLHCKTYGIDFFVVHLSPASWKFRLKEAEIIKNIIDSITHDTKQYMLLGDFNAHSPFDGELYKQNPELIKKYQKGDSINESKGILNRNLADHTLDYSVMSRFLSFPLVDVTQRFVPWYNRYSFPTPILIGVWRTAGNIGRTPERIDYILTSPEMSNYCKSVKIYNVEANDYISDHYPVEAIFEIEKGNTTEK